MSSQAAVSSHDKRTKGPTLTDIYYRWFDVRACDNAELIRQSQRLRYQVYCVETGFENPADNPEGLEIDAADAHSLHSLLIHKPSGMVAGTVRLILPDSDSPDRGLPSIAVSPALRGLGKPTLPPSRTAEISRFSISKAFRRRVDDGLYPKSVLETHPDSLGRRALPSITLGLMRAIVAMTRAAEMSHVTAVIEPALERLLLRLGIRFERTGETVAYHGTRYPVYRDMTELLAEIYEHNFEVWQAITGDGRLWPIEGVQERLRA